MTTAPVLDSNSPEAWKTFAAHAEGLDPGETVTERAHRELARRAGSAATNPTAPPLTLAELPLVPVAPAGEGPGSADFEVTGLLGEGGMGRVLSARQRSLRREVAIKVVKDDARPGTRDALLAEAVVTGSLEHPGVVPVHALGRDADGRPLLVMKRIEGVSWRVLAREAEHPAWAIVAGAGEDRLEVHLDILMAACNAVHFAHSRGIVHRDIKLENVMIGSFGEVYVVDWGIATRMPEPGARARGPTVGTPAYMAPELVKGDLARTDARTDVYLLGATLHAVLTGSSRHAASSLYEALHLAHASEPYAYRSDVPAELAAICNRATSRDPADRFASALDLRRAVADFRRHRGSIALSDEAAARLSELGARTHAAGPDDDIQVRRLMTECRFGFVQALRIWAANAAARAGLQACLEAMIEHEIARQDADGARALCAELPEARPDLVRRIDDLAAELARRKAQLGALERNQDLRIGGAAQLAIVGALPVAVGVVMIFLGLGRELKRAEILGGPAAMFLLHVTGALLARKRLSTAISRRAMGALALIPACAFVHRLIALERGSPLPAIMATDLVIAAFMFGVLAITLVPWLGWAVLPFGAGAIGAALRPDLATPIFMASLTSGMGLVAVLWRRAVRS